MLRRELLRLVFCQIRVEVNLVNLPFSVRDAQGRLVKGLTKDDFEVFEDGTRQTISHFSQAADTPLALGLVADASGSQEEFLKEHRQHLRDFLKVTLQARDQAFLLCFGNNLRLVSPFTNQSDQLEERLRAYQKSKTGRDFPRVGPAEKSDLGTAFYDAIFHATEDLLAKAETGRRALLVFSDGEDNSSAHHLLEAIECSKPSSARSHRVLEAIECSRVLEAIECSKPSSARSHRVLEAIECSKPSRRRSAPVRRSSVCATRS
ncbi:MAG: VWA domain-containing protein [Acidobacteria bacterium]|nr:VWA domain-containing protein [Acidobacteriota bacterium]